MPKKFNDLLAAVSILVILGLIYFFHPWKGKNEGLYIHVRKGQQYIKEGKYEEGLYMLHKAYEGLPSSDKIRADLLAGYIQYSRVLDQRGEKGQAISYMKMAYEMDQESEPVIYDLSYLYCELAVEESMAKNYGNAAKNMQKAVELAMKSRKVRKGIAGYLFSVGVDSFNENDNKTCEFALNSAYVLYSRYQVLIALGRYYYKVADYNKALFYWEKALKLTPGDVYAEKKIEKVQKEIELNKNMVKIETPHFNVELHGQYSIDPQDLQDVLDKIYYEVGENLDYYPPEGTRLIFYSEKDFKQIFQKEEPIRAFYDGSIRMIFIPDPKDPMFKTILAHEYTHALVSMITENKCPVWLQEGIAVYEQTRYTPVEPIYLGQALLSGQVLSLRDLEKSFKEETGEYTVLGLNYESALSAVRFIVDTWGWTGVEGLLQRIKNGRHFANAIDEEFYISVTVFNEMWNEYVKKEII